MYNHASNAGDAMTWIHNSGTRKMACSGVTCTHMYGSYGRSVEAYLAEAVYE